MSHAQQFDDDDPILAKVRELCFEFPGAAEKVSHGRPAFFTKKIFTTYGAVLKGEHHTGQYDQSVLFMPDADEVPALIEHKNVFMPAYWGPSGWLGYDLSGKKVDWAEVAELIEESYRNTAPKKLIAQLDLTS